MSIGEVARPEVRVDITGAQTIQRIEEELSEINSLQPTRLRLPLKLESRQFGGEASLLQLLITWARQRPNTTLETYLSARNLDDDSDVDGKLRKLVEKPFGLVALCMSRDVADTNGQLFTEEANTNVSKELELFFSSRRQSSQLELWGDGTDRWDEDDLPKHGPKVFLPVIDHHKNSRLPPVCFSTGEPRERNDFVGLADRLLRRLYDNRVTSNLQSRAAPFSPELTRDLGAILHELFKNTYQWARHDTDWAVLHRSFRGILFEIHSGRREQLETLVDRMPQIKSFLRNSQTSSDKLRFVEISIVDSGPGLAARWLSEHDKWQSDLSCSEEMAACRRCLEMGRTTSFKDDRGIGLHEVITTLSALHGFLRIRTGRLSLYRDFVQTPFNEHEDESGHLLLDWTSQSADIQPLTRVAGTLFTMLIPID